MRTQLNDTYPPRRDYEVRIFTIPPEGEGQFHDFGIPISFERPGQIIEGEIEFRLRYGRIDKLWYELKTKKKST